MRNICGIFMKRSSLQNSVSKFTPKKFYEIDPRSDFNHYNIGVRDVSPRKQPGFIEIGG
jgi:hypothetical protein